MPPKDAFGHHEVLDRVHIILDSLASNVREHPVVVDNPIIAEATDAAIDTLTHLYRVAGVEADKARG